MAITAMQSAASGLRALDTRLDVIANNLANVNTEGFKTSRVNFEDLMYIERAQPGVETAIGDQKPTGLYVGLGTRVSGTQQKFTQGSPVPGGPTDLMIEGRGFFKVRVENDLGSGGFAYTRTGNFVPNSNGDLVLANSDGRLLDPTINIPIDATGVTVDGSGRVTYTQAGNPDPVTAGDIKLTIFMNPAGLKQVGTNLWVESAASGQPVEGDPGTTNYGKIRNNFLEGSNVDPSLELIELIRTQRAFEMNSQAIRAADETLQSVAQLRR
ncbi:MAG: flagellar basal-body rod protein FlgG [Phycisphaerales bacterium]